MRATLLLVVALGLAIPACAGEPWTEYGPYAKAYLPLPPTPEGDGHLGNLESGQGVQLRFAVPTQRPEAFWVTLGNIVAFTGKGQSYQLVIRRDSETGEVVHEGLVIPDGDAWNAGNREPVDLSKALTAADCAKGYLDLFVTGLVTGDGWTVYRQGTWRQMSAYAAVLTPAMRQQKAQMATLRQRGISLLPMPKEVEVGKGEMQVRGVMLGENAVPDRLASGELHERIRELGDFALGTKREVPVSVYLLRADRDRGNLASLRKEGFVAKPTGKPEGYSLEVRSQRALVLGDDEAGLFYGVQTLRQLLRNEKGKLVAPVITIRDWPSYPLRGFQYDIARGQTVDLDFCKRVIQQSARHKLNAIMFYMEDDYKFEKYPFLGRPGTFDKQKALELSKFADQYHVMLIPQYESLGHAGAVLSHPEMAPLREAGNAWVFCTCEPQVWEFLDEAFAELAAAFPNSEYLHVGGDEFEMSFGLCPQCKAIVAEKGYEGLYALHMNKLADLCRKHNRIMLFWPSHQGPSEELSWLTLKAKDMTRDCIPTEWIYHGPAAYPEIAQYQEAGFRDVWMSPAVVDYSVIWPDYVTTFRGIKGFYQAGADRKAGGALCTSWELMYGALFENSWYGFIYAAECGWSLGQSGKSDYDRAFAANWFGLTGADASAQINDLCYRFLPDQSDLGLWRGGLFVQKAFWCAPGEFRRKYMQRYPLMAETAGALEEAMREQQDRLAAMRQAAKTNQTTLDAAEVGVRMHAQLARKCLTFEQAAKLYAAVREKLAAPDLAGAETALKGAAQALRDLLPEYQWLTEKYQFAVDHWGHWNGDVTALGRQVEGVNALADRLDGLAAEVAAGRLPRLPAGEEVGLGLNPVLVVGTWVPAQLSEEYHEVRFDISPFLKGSGEYRFLWQYTHGAHALRLRGNTLLCDGQPVAEDQHDGVTGASDSANTYVLALKQHEPGKKYELSASVAGHGGPDSNGEITMIVE